MHKNIMRFDVSCQETGSHPTPARERRSAAVTGTCREGGAYSAVSLSYQRELQPSPGAGGTGRLEGHLSPFSQQAGESKAGEWRRMRSPVASPRRWTALPQVRLLLEAGALVSG